TRLHALGVPTPRADRVRVTLSRSALTTTVRVVDRVHRCTTHRRSDTAPPHGASLAVAAQVVLLIADFADRCAAIDVHLAHLVRTQTNRRVGAFARGELRRGAGGTRELTTLARLQLDVVDRRTDRNVTQRHAVTGFDRRLRPRPDGRPPLAALGRQEVPAPSVRVQHQRKMRAAVRIVLQPLDLARHTVLVAQEIDQPVLLLVAV